MNDKMTFSAVSKGIRKRQNDIDTVNNSEMDVQGARAMVRGASRRWKTDCAERRCVAIIMRGVVSFHCGCQD